MERPNQSLDLNLVEMLHHGRHLLKKVCKEELVLDPPKLSHNSNGSFSLHFTLTLLFSSTHEITQKKPSKRLMNVFQCIFVLNFTWWVEMWQKKQKQKSAGVQILVHLIAVTKPQVSGSCSSHNDPHYRLWVCDVNV